MKKSLYILLILFFLTHSIYAQTKWQWAKQAGSAVSTAYNSTGNGIAYSRTENVFEVGNFNGKDVDFCSGLLTASPAPYTTTDIYIQKRNSTTGNCAVVSVRAGAADRNDVGNAVAVDNSTGNNHAFIVGRTYRTASFGCLPPISTITSATTGDWFIASYLNDLSCANWVKTYGHSTIDDEAKSVVYDGPSNLLYVTGRLRDRNAFVRMVNNSSSVAGEWQIDFAPIGGASESTGTGVTTDVDGLITATGYFRGTVNIYHANGTLAGSMTSAGGIDSYVLHIRPGGLVYWYATIGGTGDDKANGIVANDVSQYGGTYVTGTTNSPNVNFDSGKIGGSYVNSGCTSPTNKTAVGNGDIFVGLYVTGHSAGTYGCFEAASILGSSTGTEASVAITYRSDAGGGNGPVVTGTLTNSPYSTFDIAPVCTTTVTGREIYVLKLDQKCTLTDAWFYNRLPKSLNSRNNSNAICTDKRGYFYITGGFRRDLHFYDPIGMVLSELPAGNINCFSAKIESMSHAGQDGPFITPCTTIGTPAIPNYNYNWCLSNCVTTGCLLCTQCSTLPQPCVSYISANSLIVTADCVFDGTSLSGGYDADIVRIGNPSCRIAGNEINTPEKSVIAKIHPNPSNGKFTLSLKEIASDFKGIMVTDIAGKQIQYKTIIKDNDEVIFDLENAKPGLYFINVNTATQNFKSRIQIH